VGLVIGWLGVGGDSEWAVLVVVEQGKGSSIKESKSTLLYYKLFRRQPAYELPFNPTICVWFLVLWSPIKNIFVKQSILGEQSSQSFKFSASMDKKKSGISSAPPTN